MMLRSKHTCAFAIAACASLLPAAPLAAPQIRDIAPARVAGTAEVSGTLVAGDPTPTPIRRATVTLKGDTLGALRIVAVTDDAGVFAFTSVPAGRYTLTAAKGGYLSSAYGSKRPNGLGTPIVVGDGQRVAGLAMKLVRGSVLSGRVIDEHGQPVPDVTVAAFHYAASYITGARTLQQVNGPSTQVTDDRGVYRIYGLHPGEYYVATSSSLDQRVAELRAITDIQQITDADVRRASLLLRESGGLPVAQIAQSTVTSTRPAASMVKYVSVFHPSALMGADATAITLGNQEERTGIDIQLRAVPTARVEGVAIGSDGTPVVGASVTMHHPGPLPEGMIVMAARSAKSDREGKFVLPSISPGRYTITATLRGATALSGQTEIAVDGRDLSASLVMTPGVTVSGRMVFEGTSPKPDPTQIELFLRGESEAGWMRNTSTRQLSPDGTFSFTGVAPGAYRAAINSLGSLPKGWMLKSVTIGTDTVDRSDAPLEVRPDQNIDSVVVAFSDRAGQISGTMQDAAGKPAPEYVIIICASDKRYWTVGTRRTQHVRPSADGQFVVRDLPPGDYLISALTDVEDGEWNDPAFLAQLAASGPIKITLGDGERKVQDIRVGG